MEHHSRCAHCKDLIAYEYSLNDKVWEQTGIGYHGGVLHFECVEKLIGRKLTLDDFAPYRNNDGIRWALKNLARS